MSTAIAVLGMQWGDEGKGKVVDYLCAENFDIVVRFNGGPNAGHSVVTPDGERKKVHQIPSGVFQGKICVLANGMVIDPEALVQEMKTLEDAGLSLPPIIVSDCAHMIFQRHRDADAKAEKGRSEILGTTLKGNGPAYSDKSLRTGVRMGDHLRYLTGQEYKADRDLLVMDTVKYLNDIIDKGDKVLFEGAHGACLDIDHGTYPHVSSSNCTIGGIGTGAGVSPRRVDRVVGVFKAYCTRIGTGPFPSEMKSEEVTNFIREKGREYGTTTGRPRRIGWLDLPALRRTCSINQPDYLSIAMLDVLSGIETIEVVTAYLRSEGSLRVTLDAMPQQKENISTISLKGWDEIPEGCDSFERLPMQAQDFISKIECMIDRPILLISTGPRRDQMIDRRTWKQK